MIVAFRWLLRIFAGLVILSVLSLGVLYYFLARSVPDYKESFEISGISAPIEIVRNNANVPHIFGQTTRTSTSRSASRMRRIAFGR